MSLCIVIEMDNIIIDCTPAIRTYYSFGRLVANNLSNWIHASNLTATPPRNPSKVIFELKIVGKTHKYILYPYQMNLVCK